MALRRRPLAERFGWRTRHTGTALPDALHAYAHSRYVERPQRLQRGRAGMLRCQGRWATFGVLPQRPLCKHHPTRRRRSLSRIHMGILRAELFLQWRHLPEHSGSRRHSEVHRNHPRSLQKGQRKALWQNDQRHLHRRAAPWLRDVRSTVATRRERFRLGEPLHREAVP